MPHARYFDFSFSLAIVKARFAILLLHATLFFCFVLFSEHVLRKLPNVIFGIVEPTVYFRGNNFPSIFLQLPFAIRYPFAIRCILFCKINEAFGEKRARRRHRRAIHTDATRRCRLSSLRDAFTFEKPREPDPPVPLHANAFAPISARIQQTDFRRGRRYELSRRA